MKMRHQCEDEKHSTIMKFMLFKTLKFSIEQANIVWQPCQVKQNLVVLSFDDKN